MENESRQSQKRIADFVQFFQINMEEFDPPHIADYPTFQEFFIRKHAPNSRPISDMNDDVCPLISLLTSVYRCVLRRFEDSRL